MYLRITNLIYQNPISLFYNYSGVVGDLEDLIKYPSNILDKELEEYCNFLNSRVSGGELSPNSVG